MKNININKLGLIILIFGFGLFVQSCEDCDLVTTTFECRVREATVPEFDPRLILIGNEVTIVPTYNNQTFRFPDDITSSGTLTNDNRYESEKLQDQFLVIEQTDWTYPVDNKSYKVQIVNMIPPNAYMIGDIMVIDVDTISNYALIRFKGNVAQFPEKFLYEDAYKFCNEYLPNYRTKYTDPEYRTIANQGSLYGVNIVSPVADTSVNHIRVLDSDGNDVSSTMENQVPQDIITNLNSKVKSVGHSVYVKIGDVFYYRAINGKEFAVIVSNIFKGTLEPKINRVTLRFSELKGKDTQECKP